MKRVMITGIGGGIGIHMFAHVMHNTNWHVVGIDSFRHNGMADRVAEMLDSHPDWRKRLTMITHDLNAPFTPVTQRRIGEVDYIINLASLSDVSVSIEDPVNFIRNNTDIMLTMLEFARSMPELEAFLHFSTDEVYGPTGRDSGGHREWSTILPSNPYAASKAAQEAFAVAYWRSYNVPVIITNTMNNFGEMQSPKKFPNIVVQRILDDDTIDVHTSSDGEIGTRYYLHSRNAADAVLYILDNTEASRHKPGHIDKPDKYNIVGDKQLNNLELAKVIGELIGKAPKCRLVDFHSDQPGHDLHYGLNGDKLKQLGWKPPVPFEDSMKSTIEWTLEHPEWT